MNISDNVAKLRNWMEFKKYSPQSVKNYCSNFTSFLTHFEKLGVTHPDRINADMIIVFLSKFAEPATHSGYHSAIKIYYEKVAHIGIEKFKYIERPRKNKKLPIVLSVDEIQRMFVYLYRSSVMKLQNPISFTLPKSIPLNWTAFVFGVGIFYGNMEICFRV